MVLPLNNIRDIAMTISLDSDDERFLWTTGWRCSGIGFPIDSWLTSPMKLGESLIRAVGLARIRVEFPVWVQFARCSTGKRFLGQTNVSRWSKNDVGETIEQARLSNWIFGGHGGRLGVQMLFLINSRGVGQTKHAPLSVSCMITSILEYCCSEIRIDGWDQE